MCEIAVFDPEQADLSIIQQTAAVFHEEQGDGLGVLAIKQSGDKFGYTTYKSTQPHWATLYSFLKRNVDDTWRFVVHGRAGTCGGVNRDAAHPIHVDCDKCEFDYVVHNGSVRRHRNIRAGLTSHGHDFNTKVDSEVLAHKVSELPETIEDHTRGTYSFTGNLNYLLFSEDGILVRTSKKYHVTDDFTMTCSLRNFEDAEDVGFERGNKMEWMLLTPTEDGVETETKDHTKKTSRTGSKYNSRTAAALWNGAESGGAESEEEDDGFYSKTYVDHCEDFDYIHALKVAPGVMEVIDENKGESMHVFRDEDPRLYYWYAPESPPEDASIDYLEQLAEETPDPEGEQSSLEQYEEMSDEVKKEAADAATRAVAEATGNVSVEEAADISEEVYEMMESGDNAIRGTIGE
jgi:predicted glutamine amidotransferase